MSDLLMDCLVYSAFPEEINLSDVMPEGDPTDFHRSMLDAVNEAARDYGWTGVFIATAGWDPETRILSLCCREGDAPATLHLFKKMVAAQKAYVAIEGGKAE